MWVFPVIEILYCIWNILEDRSRNIQMIIINNKESEQLLEAMDVFMHLVVFMHIYLP